MTYRDTLKALMSDVEDLLSDLEADNSIEHEDKQDCIYLLDQIYSDMEEALRALPKS